MSTESLTSRSPGPISMNVWHRVDLARHNRHGTMVIDAETTARGHSKVQSRNIKWDPSETQE